MPVLGPVLCEEMGSDESAGIRWFHTVGILIVRGQRAGGWRNRGANPKLWSRLRGTLCGRIDFSLTFDGTYLAPCFASVSTMTAR